MQANAEMLDALIRHQIGLMRLTGSIRNQVLAVLDETEADIRAQIRKRKGKFTVTRLRVLEQVITKIRGQAWNKIDELWFSEMEDLVKAEPEFMSQVTKTVAPVTINMVLPSVSTLTSLVKTTPFEGHILRDWASNIRKADLDRILSEVRIGMVQGEDSQSIARRVVGSVAMRGADGVTQITRNNAVAITRTMVNHFSNQARRKFLEENKSVFSEELYVATLDSRTTPICRDLDGDRFPIAEGPIPPVHMGCRSLRVGFLDENTIAVRPTKSSTDKILLGEYTKTNNLPTVTSRGALPRGHRGEFDKFSRKRVRELTGTVPAKVNYQQFLERQSVEFQEEVLGVTKAKLFRQGKLTLDRFVDRAGNELTLKQLANNDAWAFRAAGLNPDDF